MLYHTLVASANTEIVTWQWGGRLGKLHHIMVWPSRPPTLDASNP